MMRQYELVERVLAYDPAADEALLNRAYVYAMKAHARQVRDTGDPYFSHPLEVASILTELKLDDATIAAALLHDVIEDTDSTREEIDRLFGAEIGALVEGLTKIQKLDLVTKKAEQAENFRKLLLAIASDIRVLLIKLADRLHNMRTLEHKKKPESRQRTAEETIDIYAPLAGRMGMQSLREELEDLAFKALHPEAYQAVVIRLAEIRTKNGGLIEEMKGAITMRLAEAGVKAEITGREKKPYSIWRKMENKQISLEKLSDIYAFRVVVQTLDDCYKVLGIAHKTWNAVPGRFKDYISTPKQNGYQSVHTTVVGPRHQRAELQIRSSEMHEIAEYGVAAHALYKDRQQSVAAAANGAAKVNGIAARPIGEEGPSPHAPHAKENPYTWLRRLVKTLLEGDKGDTPEDFLEHTKLELFQDQVFCFTPKGLLIALPRGATPIDFAYAVHTDVGKSFVGAMVNGMQVPMTTALRNGDEVNVLTAKGHTPPAAWERIAVTGKARSAIRRAARDGLRQQYTELGRRLVTAAFVRAGAEYGDDKLRKALPRLAQKSVEDVLALVGRDEMPAVNVVRAVLPDAKFLPSGGERKARNRRERGQIEEGWFNLRKSIGLKFRWPGSAAEAAERSAAGPAIPIRGLRNDVPVKFEEGGAVPGDRIVGVLDGAHGIRIFQIHSPRLKDFEDARWIDVTWDIDAAKPERFLTKIMVTAINEPGTLAQVAQVIGEADGNIDNVRMIRRAADFTEMLFEIEVWDLDHLNEIIAGLKARPVLNKVERVFE